MLVRLAHAQVDRKVHKRAPESTCPWPSARCFIGFGNRPVAKTNYLPGMAAARSHARCTSRKGGSRATLACPCWVPAAVAFAAAWAMADALLPLWEAAWERAWATAWVLPALWHRFGHEYTRRLRVNQTPTLMESKQRRALSGWLVTGAQFPSYLLRTSKPVLAGRAQPALQPFSSEASQMAGRAAPERGRPITHQQRRPGRSPGTATGCCLQPPPLRWRAPPRQRCRS
jgi:hypothetical protein